MPSACTSCRPALTPSWLQIAASLIGSRLQAEQERRAAIEEELRRTREQATALAIRACESDSALERQTRATRSLRNRVRAWGGWVDVRFF